MSKGPFTGDPIQDMFTLRDRYGMYQDEEYDVKFVKSGLSNLISGDVFEGCDVTFDPEFQTVSVTARGFDVIIELGNTDSWKNPCANGGRDEAMRILVKEVESFEEEDFFADIHVPKKRDEE